MPKKRKDPAGIQPTPEQKAAVKNNFTKSWKEDRFEKIMQPQITRCNKEALERRQEKKRKKGKKK